MSEIVIRAEGIGKRYAIGAPKARYRTIRESLSEAVRRPIRAAARLGSGGTKRRESSEFWALRDIALEVRRGEVLGIIGGNGAGKSTLLKVLSRITEPTEGWAEIRGRVASLLEVGTGFHPELTGRENIFLNGSILGMRRHEIAAKFDEIVAFAEVERFVDTAVKHYSSGMYLRLAFAVAAHLEPEILMVDEVLAVGDAAFQQKCLGKMRDVVRGGRTILFVSHNMAAVRELCARALVIDAGRVAHSGFVDEAVAHYVQRTAAGMVNGAKEAKMPDHQGSGRGHILEVGVCDSHGRPMRAIGIGEPFEIFYEVELNQASAPLVAGAEISTTNGTPLLNLRSDAQGVVFPVNRDQRRLRFSIGVPGLPLFPGQYRLDAWFGERMGERIDHVASALVLEFQSMGLLASERMIQPGRGLLLVDCEWSAIPVRQAAPLAVAASTGD
jgi:lipopolysaccharide transport system ATP-binding protein